MNETVLNETVLKENVLIVQYGEVAMRKNNRGIFIHRLVDNIRRNIDPLGNFYVQKEQGRLIIESREGALDFERVIPQVVPIFGLLGVCPGVKTKEKTLDNLKALALDHMQSFHSGKPITFKVQTKRADKTFPLPSGAVSAAIGEYILDHMEQVTVDIHTPQVTLTVEIRNDCYVYSKTIKSFGGLPAGSSGKAITLLSGGIDSPVATWLAAKRGVEVEGVYFHSPPYTSEWAKEKVLDLARALSLYTGSFRLHIVGFTDLQLYLLDNVPHDKLTIFLKRAMMRTAESIALATHAQGLVTGESIGQVASQTLQAMHAISSSTTLPVFRPLCGLDKQEIVDLARKIGTFDISIRPYEDCCTIFVAKHPETRPSRTVVEKIEQRLDKLDALLLSALEQTQVIDL